MWTIYFLDYLFSDPRADSRCKLTSPVLEAFGSFLTITAVQVSFFAFFAFFALIFFESKFGQESGLVSGRQQSVCCAASLTYDLILISLHSVEACLFAPGMDPAQQHPALLGHRNLLRQSPGGVAAKWRRR